MTLTGPGPLVHRPFGGWLKDSWDGIAAALIATRARSSEKSR